MTRARAFFDSVNLEQPIPLKADERYDQAAHRWSREEREAVTLALASGRPLLVRGEAGSGKSQLARAIAERLETGLLEETIHARYEATDILYRIDTLQRLADAEGRKDIQDWTPYIKHGKYWQACNAATQQQKRQVLLIDEIDKADSDVPNALLDVLGNRSFTVPYLDIPVKAPAEWSPLVIFTTNEERELPAAFIRRCAVLNQNPPGHAKEPFITWLMHRGNAHDYCRISPDLRAEAAAMVWEDREAALHEGYPPVGLAEYIDLLRALHELAADDEAEQRRWLHDLRAYALIKHRDQDQQRHRAHETRQG